RPRGPEVLGLPQPGAPGDAVARNPRATSAAPVGAGLSPPRDGGGKNRRQLNGGTRGGRTPAPRRREGRALPPLPGRPPLPTGSQSAGGGDATSAWARLAKRSATGSLPASASNCAAAAAKSRWRQAASASACAAARVRCAASPSPSASG